MEITETLQLVVVSLIAISLLALSVLQMMLNSKKIHFKKFGKITIDLRNLTIKFDS